MKVEMVPMMALKLDECNARSHPQRNMEAIDASIEAFGVVEPLVVQRNSNRILGGNGRYHVLQKRGATEAPVVFVDFDDVKADALAIALNRTAELAEWNLEQLAVTLRALSADGAVDIQALGWKDYELEPLLQAEWAPAEPEGDLEDHQRSSTSFPGQELFAKCMERVRKKFPDASEDDCLLRVCQAFMGASE